MLAPILATMAALSQAIPSLIAQPESYLGDLASCEGFIASVLLVFFHLRWSKCSVYQPFHR